MGVLEDYLNNLEGKTDLDPQTIAREMLELANQELGTRNAKIDELNNTVATNAQTVAERDAEIQRWKAKNFDLAMQIPAEGDKSNEKGDEGEVDSLTITPDDLFEN